MRFDEYLSIIIIIFKQYMLSLNKEIKTAHAFQISGMIQNEQQQQKLPPYHNVQNQPQTPLIESYTT